MAKTTASKTTRSKTAAKKTLFAVNKTTGKEQVVAIFNAPGDAALAVKLFNQNLSDSAKKRLKYIAR